MFSCVIFRLTQGDLGWRLNLTLFALLSYFHHFCLSFKLLPRLNLLPNLISVAIAIATLFKHRHQPRCNCCAIFDPPFLGFCVVVQSVKSYKMFSSRVWKALNSYHCTCWSSSCSKTCGRQFNLARPILDLGGSRYLSTFEHGVLAAFGALLKSIEGINIILHKFCMQVMTLGKTT